MLRARRFVALFGIITMLVLIVGGIGCSGGEESNAPTGSSSSEGEGTGTAGGISASQQLVESKCSMCHSLDRVWGADKTPAGWVSTVDRMKGNGLVVTDEEYRQIVDFLSSQ